MTARRVVFFSQNCMQRLRMLRTAAGLSSQACDKRASANNHVCPEPGELGPVDRSDGGRDSLPEVVAHVGRDSGGEHSEESAFRGTLRLERKQVAGNQDAVADQVPG